MDQIQQTEQEDKNVAAIVFKPGPKVRIIPNEEEIPEMVFEDPERWDGLS
jgi:hypothetical protein